MSDKKTFRVLIMGLPGSGKTTMSLALSEALGHVPRWNADDVRKRYDDWDFSPEGRLRQAHRMKELADTYEGIVLCDFVCPTPETLEAFDPHFVIWMDTIESGRFEDTNKVFTAPKYFDRRVTSWDYNQHDIAYQIRDTVPQGVMIGRFQPWHDGHRALFQRIMDKHGFVTVMVRKTKRGPKDPFPVTNVRSDITADLRKRYPQSRFRVMAVPNVAGVYYGRDVGYAVEKLELPEVAHVSATAIRQELAEKGELP